MTTTNFKTARRVKVRYNSNPFYVKKNKYGAIKKDGYDSLIERDDALYLKSLVQSGVIKCCDEKKQFDLFAWSNDGSTCCKMSRHIPDFLVTLNDGRQKVVETKGFPTDKWKMNLKLWPLNYPDIEYIVSTKIDPIWLKEKVLLK